ncbi:MAG: ketoacyl-ACP synthase III [Tannerella sp.]|jgi:3-oxoacyl-[acyl-carrier-protein] synthase-3|nr:ketoacyl-ACP synthase III [Tannerella sp.]
MYVNATGFYIPEQRIDNEYFTQKTGLTDDWFIQRTGIKTRSRARDDENVNTMSVEAVKNALPSLSYDITEVDLIISATYSPFDMLGTAAHVVQRVFNIPDAKAFSITSACSSFINALEIAEGYFATGKAKKALILGGDKNSAYSDDNDPKTGHLWGDAAAVFFVSADRISENDSEILDINTEGLGCVSKGPEGVTLRLLDQIIAMPEGKDVFVQACTYMPKNAQYLLEMHGYSFDDLSYFIGHQANMRILKNIAENYKIPESKILSNIEELGNTGSASCALVFAQNQPKFRKGDLVCISAFGGGYSAGACLVSI